MVKNGMIQEAFIKLRNEWSSLPGASEEGMSLDEAIKVFKQGVSKELNGNSIIETPQGTLFNNQ